jgi:hypothetical protein
MSKAFRLAAILLVVGPSTPYASETFNRRAVFSSGRPSMFEFVTSLNPDCSLLGLPTVRVTADPSHGSLKLVPGKGYSQFRPDNQRYQCNRHRVPGIQIFYTSRQGYIGDDRFELSVITFDGREYIYKVQIDVK